MDPDSLRRNRQGPGLPEQTIGASYGDALLAARSVGLVDPGANWSKISETVEPEDENMETYDELYRIYRELYPSTREQMPTLTDMQNRGGGVA